MSLNFSVNTAFGPQTVTSQELLHQYGQFAGLQPVGLSQDGASGIYQTPQGMQTIPFHEVMQQAGININSYKPTNTIPAENLGKYRMALESISDPDVQKAYLQNVAAKDFGIEKPLILQEGTSAYLWAPEKGAWVAMTNEEGLDRGDVISGATSVGKGILGVAGGILGGAGAGVLGLPSGPGAVATAALGAGAGGALATGLGETAQRAIVGGLDPEYSRAYGGVGNAIKGEAGEVGKQALIGGRSGCSYRWIR